MIFENIVGNNKVKETLKKILESKKIANSYMLIGEDSIGKLLFAKEFAKVILCSSNDACNTCKSCLEFDNLNNPDFNIVVPEGKIIRIDQIRELTKKVYEKPIISSKKVYIIDDSNLMNKEAQNALLKTLEEPPEYVTIILVASNESMFLPTIKSRCTKILFNKLSNEELKNILIKEFNWNNVSDFILKVASGSVKKALELKEKEDEYKKVDKIFTNLEKFDITDLFMQKEEIFKEKDETENILNYINLLLFESINKNIKYANCMKIIENTKDRLNKNCNYDMTIDNLLLTIWEEING